MKVLKGKGKVISANRQDRGSDWEPSPTACTFVSSSPSFFSHRLFLDAILFTQFVHEITEGEVWEEN